MSAGSVAAVLADEGEAVVVGEGVDSVGQDVPVLATDPRDLAYIKEKEAKTYSISN